MATTERTIGRGRPQSTRDTRATSLRVTPTCLELWDALASREGLSRTGYLETTIRRLAAEKKMSTEADSGADITTQAAMAGPIAEVWDTPEEDEAWAHLSGLPPMYQRSNSPPSPAEEV